jgi:hypothetical protein
MPLSRSMRSSIGNSGTASKTERPPRAARLRAKRIQLFARACRLSFSCPHLHRSLIRWSCLTSRRFPRDRQGVITVLNDSRHHTHSPLYEAGLSCFELNPALNSTFELNDTHVPRFAIKPKPKTALMGTTLPHPHSMSLVGTHFLKAFGGPKGFKP